MQNVWRRQALQLDSICEFQQLFKMMGALQLLHGGVKVNAKNGEHFPLQFSNLAKAQAYSVAPIFWLTCYTCPILQPSFLYSADDNEKG